MWPLTPFGLYSAVKKHGDTCLTVRAPEGEHLSITTVTRYWRMRPVEDTGRFGPETEAVDGVTPDEARRRVRTTTTGAHTIGRDVRVLELAVKAFEAPR